ncbi:MAG TPA: cupin domain-containing protein [Solirubrobacterales bacterium]|nr:cupin domain-containing protein [Solirubrobacterales bacterium]
MADYTAKKIGDIEAIYGGGFKLARADLGVESFGMQILEMPPGYADYPEHDHAETGQEEVYLVLRGSAEIDVEGERLQLDPDTVIRVGPTAKRKITPGDEGVRLLALGGTPGGVYEAPEGTQLGTPDPLAQA